MPAVLGLAGCGVIETFFGDGLVFGGKQRVEFRISDKLNENYPVAVDLIVVYSKDLDKELTGLTAEQWFALRAQYLRDFSTADIEAFRWEWVPGQSAAAQTFKYRSGARSAIVFVSYASPGDHRVRVEAPNSSLRVILDENDFAVEAI